MQVILSGPQKQGLIVARNPRNNADSEVGYDLNADGVSSGKGRATPTRKEKEEARKRPLVSNDRAEARRRARAAQRVAQDKAREGMAAGVERYLPMRDRGVQKRYVRDYVDARTSIGEFLIPLMFIVIVMSLFPQIALQFASTALILFFFLAAIADAVIMGLLLRRRMRAKFGENRVEKGIRWYAAMRSFQLRIMRLPKPQVKRGRFPE